MQTTESKLGMTGSTEKNGQTFVTKFLAHVALADLPTVVSKELEQPGSSTNRITIGGLLKRFCGRGSVTTAEMEVSDEMLGSMFEGQMRNSDCARDVYGAESFGSWDPVLHDWVEQPDCRAALLFPWKYYSNKEAVFGLRCMKNVVLDVHPINGPFLHKSIEWALVHGIIAIVPDVDVYPVDETTISFNDKQETELIEEGTQILRDWNADKIKEYKIVVLDRKHAMASTPPTIHDGGSVLHLHQLHNCKLIFLTSHRLKTRYLWWTFFSSANIASWRLDSCEGDADRYRLNRGILTTVRY
ncbi:hypothetical protein CFIO01_07387 [Colletotrichum fioriniae PJ7]|uniref:Uncharacterized protein n=1 Tax=Colletotrichum fioriniae PJ7 TaxID=1445577 RepID=A0A010R7U0_9PEZI|nr:hypothetical protein CFIO01_07387 [Colletotrichum fioriniae PJ7]